MDLFCIQICKKKIVAFQILSKIVSRTILRFHDRFWKFLSYYFNHLKKKHYGPNIFEKRRPLYKKKKIEILRFPSAIYFWNNISKIWKGQRWKSICLDRISSRYGIASLEKWQNLSRFWREFRFSDVGVCGVLKLEWGVKMFE